MREKSRTPKPIRHRQVPVGRRDIGALALDGDGWIWECDRPSYGALHVNHSPYPSRPVWVKSPVAKRDLDVLASSMYHAGMKKERGPTEQQVIALAAKAQCTLRTARRALVDGVEKIRGDVLRARLRRAMSEP